MKRKDKGEAKRREKGNGGFAVLLTQSAVVIGLLLAALLFRCIGGTAFDELRDRFAKAVQDNTFVEAIVSPWISAEGTQPSEI